jgi:hypothetical protein
MSKLNYPDIDKVYETIDKIKELGLKKTLLDLEIKFKEAEITRTVSADPKYFQVDAKGTPKPPAMNFVEATYMQTGLDGELVPLRKEYATLCVELEQSKLMLDALKMQADLWRTEAANQRNNTL